MTGDNEQTFLVFGRPASEKGVWIAAAYERESGISKTLSHLRCRHYSAVVTIGDGKTMIIGGWWKNQYFSSVELFDTRKQQVYQMEPMNTPRSDHGACAVGDTVVVCGGWRGNRTRLRSCEIYSPAELRWKQLPDLKEARVAVALVSLPDKWIFCIGGADERGRILTSVVGYSLTADLTSRHQAKTCNDVSRSWKKFASTREARSSHSAIHLAGFIFVVGGVIGKYCLTTHSPIEMFIPPNSHHKSGQWCSIATKLKVARSKYSLIGTHNGIYAFGNHKSPYNTMEKLDAIRTNNPLIDEKCSIDGVTSTEVDPVRELQTFYYIWGVSAIPKQSFLNVVDT